MGSVIGIVVIVFGSVTLITLGSVSAGVFDKILVNLEQTNIIGL